MKEFAEGWAISPLHSFLFFIRVVLSFPSGGQRDCKLSERTVRKQEVLLSTRESEMKSICGACSRGTGEPLLQSAISFLQTRRHSTAKNVSSHRWDRPKVTRIPKQPRTQEGLDVFASLLRCTVIKELKLYIHMHPFSLTL